MSGPVRRTTTGYFPPAAHRSSTHRTTLRFPRRSLAATLNLFFCCARLGVTRYGCSFPSRLARWVLCWVYVWHAWPDASQHTSLVGTPTQILLGFSSSPLPYRQPDTAVAQPSPTDVAAVHTLIPQLGFAVDTTTGAIGAALFAAAARPQQRSNSHVTFPDLNQSAWRSSRFPGGPKKQRRAGWAHAPCSSCRRLAVLKASASILAGYLVLVLTESPPARQPPKATADVNVCDLKAPEAKGKRPRCRRGNPGLALHPARPRGLPIERQTVDPRQHSSEVMVFKMSPDRGRFTTLAVLL